MHGPGIDNPRNQFRGIIPETAVGGPSFSWWQVSEWRPSGSRCCLQMTHLVSDLHLISPGEVGCAEVEDSRGTFKIVENLVVDESLLP